MKRFAPMGWAVSLIVLGAGLDQLRGRRHAASARRTAAAQEAALDAEISAQEQLRHESELKSGEFDLQG